MNFFQAQEEARQRTKWLVVYFAMAVIAIIVSAYIGVAGSIALIAPRQQHFEFNPFLWNGNLFAIVGLFTVVIILGGVAYKSLQLKKGGGAVAEAMGGRPVLPDSGDFKERQLLNVVEEMAIASGTPVPLVYVMDQEMGINAFAAGTEPSDAAIGVTRGCMELLSRAELQGVIAHEFSHIRNGDMKLNMRLIGFIFGILVLMIVGRILLSSLRYTRPSRNNKEGGGLLVVLLVSGLVLFLVGAVGGFFARLIQAAVSRQREFLADASAVQFTRDPGGLIGAFKKIGGWGERAQVKSPQASAASHIFFAEGGLFRWGLATHPPLRVRIRALDPNVKVTYFDEVALPEVEVNESTSTSAELVGLSSPAIGAASVPVADRMALLGEDTDWKLEAGQKIYASIDEKWHAAARDRRKAQVLIFAMLLSTDPKKREEQVQGLGQGMGQDYVEVLCEWQESIEPLHSEAKIAILDLCIPTLRRLSQSECQRLLQMLDWVIASDERVDIFEFMLQYALSKHLFGHFAPGRHKQRRRPKAGLPASGDILLSLLAWNGRDTEGAEKSFKFAVQGSTPFEGWEPSLLGEGVFSSEMVLGALSEFDQAAPPVKKTILQMCGLVAAEDGVLTSEEAELLRIVADGIGSGIPPFSS